jgi:hypothetical protein
MGFRPQRGVFHNPVDSMDPIAIMRDPIRPKTSGDGSRRTRAIVVNGHGAPNKQERITKYLDPTLISRAKMRDD